MLSNQTKSLIVGIAGASGAGKTEFSERLKSRLIDYNEDVLLLNEDRYYRAQDHLDFEQRCQLNYDHPDAFEHELLVSHLAELSTGKSVAAPTYDFENHTRAQETDDIHPARVLILEGILILQVPEIRKLLDLAIFVDVPLDICILRRADRDTRLRNRTLQSVITQYETTVRPMYFEFIEPSKKHADLIVPHGGKNTKALEVVCSYARNY